MNEQKLDAELLIKNILKNVLQVPSKEDLDVVHQRFELLEKELSKRFANKGASKIGRPKRKTSNLDLVLDVIPDEPGEMSVKTIKKASGLEDKQVRNCLFRLEKLGKIKRVRRGFYARN